MDRGHCKSNEKETEGDLHLFLAGLLENAHDLHVGVKDIGARDGEGDLEQPVFQPELFEQRSDVWTKAHNRS